MKNQNLNFIAFLTYLQDNSNDPIDKQALSDEKERIEGIISAHGTGPVTDQDPLFRELERITNNTTQVEQGPGAEGNKAAPGAPKPTVQMALNDCFAKVISGQNFGLVDLYCFNTYGISYTNLLIVSAVAIFADNNWWFGTPVENSANFLQP